MSQLIALPTFTDERGSLTVAEGVLPFEIRRFFLIHGVSAPRGEHKQKLTWQALIATSGKVRVTCERGADGEQFTLDHPGKCLVVEPEAFRTMYFDDGATLLVLSSHPYDPDDTVWNR